MSKLSKKDILKGQIREKVRSDYAGIISEAQIDATSKYWTDFLHSLFQKKEREIYNNRDNNIVMDYLMPKATLASVGREWGVTRERIRQIFKETTGKGTQEARKSLLEDNTKFRCPLCGKPKDPRHVSRYCSKRCMLMVKQYDINTLLVCKYCGDSFYPLRNWRAIRKGRSCITGQYCCHKHYILNLKKEGRASFSKDNKFFKALNEPN